MAATVSFPTLATKVDIEQWVLLNQCKHGKARFRDFCEYAWPVVEPAMDFVPNWHIDAICDHLQAVADGQIRRLLINVPPGHAKSLLVSVLWPAWMWIRNPEGAKWRALFASYTRDLAVRDSLRCRDLMRSPWYRETYRPKWEFSRVQDQKGLFANSDHGFRISLGVGGAGTGFRGDCVVADDPINAIDQYSDAKLEACLLWWDQSMSSRLHDMRTGAKVIIMQRLSERDLSGYVLRAGGYEHLRLPTEYEVDSATTTSIGFRDPRQIPGELLFPVLFPREVVEQAKRDLGSAGFAGQHQQRPTPAGGGMLKKHWWGYWQPKGANLPPVVVRLPDGRVEHRRPVDLPDVFDLQLQSWDMAFKNTKTSDYVVGQVMAACGGDRYLLAQTRDRMDFPATLLAIRQMCETWPAVSLKLVEENANGPAVVQSLRHAVAGFVEVNPEGGKISRAAAASAQLESGHWYLPHPQLAPWVDGFITECAAFPGSLNDDQVDAWSQGAHRLMAVVGKRPQQAPRNWPERERSQRPERERSWMV